MINRRLGLMLQEVNVLIYCLIFFFLLLCCVVVLQDPAVTQHSSNTGYATLDLYNPFDNTTGVSSSISHLYMRGQVSVQVCC